LDLEYERKNQRLIDRYSKVRIYFLFVVGVLLTFISHCYFKWFYKWSFLQLVLIFLFVGCLFALLHFPLIQEEDERRVLKNAVAAIVILSLLPLFGVSYYQVYIKRKINESVYGEFYGFCITSVSVTLQLQTPKLVSCIGQNGLGYYSLLLLLYCH
jgi:hypothetical protein